MIIEIEASVLCGMTYYKKDAKGQPTNEMGASYSFLFDDEDTSNNPLSGSIMQAYASKDLCADPVKMTYLRNLKRFSRVRIQVNAPVGKQGLFVLNDIFVGAACQQNVAPQAQPQPQVQAQQPMQAQPVGMTQLQPVDDERLPF